MRKKLLVILMTMLLLCGCEKKTDASMQQALDFRSALMAAGGCTFSADFTADYGDEIVRFSADCACGKDGVTMTVTAPETLRGICAAVDDADARVIFDETEIALDLMAGRLAPLSAPYLLYAAWTEDYLQFTGREDGQLRITVLHGYNDEELTVDTWLGAEKIPLRSEIAADGETLIFAEITAFQFGTAESVS